MSKREKFEPSQPDYLIYRIQMTLDNVMSCIIFALASALSFVQTCLNITPINEQTNEQNGKHTCEQPFLFQARIQGGAMRAIASPLPELRIS